MESEHKAWLNITLLHLATRMAYGHIKEFDSTKQTEDEFCQRFKFYFAANNIKPNDEAQQARKKALFITMLRKITFIKLCDLASPSDIAALSLDNMVELLTVHYTIEIVERQVFQACSR